MNCSRVRVLYSFTRGSCFLQFSEDLFWLNDQTMTRDTVSKVQDI